MDEVQVRVGDTERRAVDERLQRAVGAGELTLHEYDERAGQVWAARTRAELDATVHDLPAAPAAAPPAVVAPGVRPRPRRVLAVMSGDRLSGPLLPGQDVQAYAVMGGAVLDLRRDDLPARVHVRVVTVMGGVEVLVPRGATVQLSGMSLMAGRDSTVDPPRSGGPVVEVEAYAVMGGVEVKHGDDPPRVSLHKPPAPSGSAALEPARQRPRHAVRNRVVAGVAVAAVAFGLSGVVGADDAAVFGSRTVQAQAGDDIDVANLFGSVRVVVPDGVAVQSGGTVVFGSTECRACSDRTPTPYGVARVHSRGAFGSVTIVHASDQGSDDDD